MTFTVIIPARYASSRLPGKPLLDIGGKPMIQHVYERALASGANQVVVATDDGRIADVVRKFGKIVMTSAEHSSGTARLAETAELLSLTDDAIVVNLQGDEPQMPPELLLQVVENLHSHPQAVMATLATPITESEEFFNPNAVKLVMDDKGYALYFSRAPIPWDRDGFARNKAVLTNKIMAYRHLGIYAYRVRFLKQYVQTPSCPLEVTESLEQLRVLWMGEKISVGIVNSPPPAGVDTISDLERVRQILN
jgi:3-deoxy-manno-octulosonate cytidylyltransferase (CMP-KDO synthetase)